MFHEIWPSYFIAAFDRSQTIKKRGEKKERVELMEKRFPSFAFVRACPCVLFRLRRSAFEIH
jgi:hypothetical protein